MVTPKNYVAFVLVGLCAWRVVACSASSGKMGPGQGGAAGTSGAAASTGNSGGAGARSGFGGASGFVGNPGSGGFLNIGQGGTSGANDMDSSCHPIKTMPEKIIITDSSIVTDTITTLTPVAIFIMQDRSSSTVTGNPAPASPDSWKNSTAAVSAFVKDPLSVGLDVGLGVFPPMNGNGDCATGSDCGMPLVPIASLPGNGMAIANAY